MLPISQLDGGHVIYGLFGRNSRLIARGFLVMAILFVVLGDHYNWTLMLVLVILLGVDHPPTRDDTVPLGFCRQAFGLVSLGIPVLCFTPMSVCDFPDGPVRTARGACQSSAILTPLADGRMAVKQENFQRVGIGIVFVQPGELAKGRDIGLPHARPRSA